MDWSEDIEKILENIRLNSIILSTYHKDRYYHYKGHLKYFKLPLIVLSSITSIASVGMTPYMKQGDISLLTCLLSLVSAILASIELYLGIQKNMEQELIASRNFLLLAYSIYKVLNLQVEHRVEKGRLFLDETYNEYIKLVENANLTKSKRMKDALAPIDESMKYTSTPTSSKLDFGMELHQLKDLENNSRLYKGDDEIATTRGVS
jgi:hypothetical protein